MIGALTDFEAILGGGWLLTVLAFGIEDIRQIRQNNRLKRELSAALNERDTFEHEYGAEKQYRLRTEQLLAAARETISDVAAQRDRMAQANTTLTAEKLTKSGEIERLNDELRDVFVERDDLRKQREELRKQLAEASKNDQRDPKTGRFVKAER